MKNNKWILLFFIITVGFAACKQKPEKKLIGLWNLKEYTNNQEVAPELKEMYKKNVEEYVRSTSFEFKEDSTLITREKGEMATGKWKVDAQLKSLTMYDDLQNSYAVVEIVSIDNKKLVLRSKNQNFEVKMTLEKAETK